MTLTKNAALGLRVVWLPFLVFMFQLIADALFRVYSMIPEFDSLMHILGGLAIGLGMCEIIRELQERGHLKKKLLSSLFIFIAVAGTGLVAILWEFYEFLLDTFFFTNNQPSMADTMADMLLGLLGALLISWWIVRRTRSSTG